MLSLAIFKIAKKTCLYQEFDVIFRSHNDIMRFRFFPDSVLVLTTQKILNVLKERRNFEKMPKRERKTALQQRLQVCLVCLNTL